MFYNTIVFIRIYEARCHEDANQKTEDQSNHCVPAAANVADIKYFNYIESFDVLPCAKESIKCS